MSTGELLVLVGIILAFVALAVVPIVIIAKRGSRRIRAELPAMLAGEPALAGPENALYRSGSGPYPKVKGNGVLVLTEQRLVFRILIGRSIDIPLGEITGVREAKTFQGNWSGGRQHLIVQTGAGEVGFFVEDNAAWIAAITGATPVVPD